MELKDHIKGVLVALASATVIIYVISFFVGSQLTVDTEVVLNAEADSVFNYMKEPANFGEWMSGTEDLRIEVNKKNNGVKYVGYDEYMHAFTYKVSNSAKGFEIHYRKEDEEMAIFKVQIKPLADGCMINYVKIWNISSNPLTRLFSTSLDEDVLAGMKKDLASVKKKFK